MDFFTYEGKEALKAWAHWAHYNHPQVGYPTRAAGIDGAPRESVRVTHSTEECELVDQFLCLYRKASPVEYQIARRAYLVRESMQSIVESVANRPKSCRWGWDKLQAVEKAVGQMLLFRQQMVDGNTTREVKQETC